MKKQLICALLASGTALSVALPTAVFAQTAPAPADAAAATDDAPAQDIIVTGSRIVRDGYTAPTPVTVATTQDLQKTTPSGVADALNKLPQFANSLSPSKAALNFSNSPIHGNVLNLRGLGTTGANPKGPLRTLILFDGLRVAPTEYVGTIDTNVLPQLLMQRVDVVTGGASAAYGSDAVAGVVNFVLDKKFTGVKGVLQGGLSEEGDNKNQRVGIAGGFDFGPDNRGHALVSAEYTHSSGMLRSDRAIGAAGYAFVGSTSTALGAPGTAANPYTIASNVLISAVAPNGRIVTPPAGSPPGTLANPNIGRVINNDGTTRAFNPGIATGTAGFQIGGDGYGIPLNNNAVAPQKNINTFGRLSYDLSSDVTAYVEGLWSRAKLRFSTQQNALVPASEAATIYKGNPYLSAALDAALPTAADFYYVGQTQAGQPLPVSNEQTDYWMATAGFEGTLANFKWNAAYTHGQSKHTLANSGLYDNKKLYAALDAVTNPANGQVTCRVLLDPTVASQYAGCQPLDVMHGDPSKSTPAGYAYATGTSRYAARIKQDSWVGNVSGSLFDLPAGPVDFAAGAEYRRQTLNLATNADPANLSVNNPSATTAQNAAATAALRANYFAGLRGVPAGALYYWLTNVGSAKGKLNVKEAFVELNVPVLKDVTGFQQLNLNGAARITDYSTSGTVTTWKIGTTWKPINDVMLRASFSRDIRAPNLFELFAGAQAGIGIVNDVRNAAGTYGSGQNVNANNITTGNPNLKPEKAKTLTVGGVITPSALRGFSFSLDYYHIKVSDLIDTLSGQQILTNCLNAGGSGAPECALITRASPTSFPSLITITPANIAYLTTAGLDIDMSYRTALSEDSALSLRLYANYLDKFDAQQYTNAPISHYAGVSVVASNPAGYPRWRGNLTVDYTNGPFGVTVGEQYIGKMRLDIPGGATRIQFVDNHVKPVFYTDLSLRYTVPEFGKAIEVFGTVNNLFDKQPPLIPGTIPGVNIPTNIAVYDFIGRAYTAGVRFKF